MPTQQPNKSELIGMLIVLVLSVTFGFSISNYMDKMSEYKRNENLHEVIRAELDKTFVNLPDGSVIYLESQPETKR